MTGLLLIFYQLWYNLWDPIVYLRRTHAHEMMTLFQSYPSRALLAALRRTNAVAYSKLNLTHAISAFDPRDMGEQNLYMTF